MGAYEHPERKITDRSSSQVHYEVAAGALADAGLSFDDVDGYFCAGDAPGGFAGPGSYGPASMIEYLGIRPRYVDSTETGGSAYGRGTGTGSARRGYEADFGETMYGSMMPAVSYALCAQRHMHEFGTTSEQLAEIKVAASIHASHNPQANMPNVVSVEDVVNSPMIASPLHRLDCCANTDGGGAVVIVSPEIAAGLGRHKGKILGQGAAPKNIDSGRTDLTYTGGVWSAPIAFSEAGVDRADIDYVSIYDSFTRSCLSTLGRGGVCENGA